LTPAVLKTVRPERVSWVRIPPPPPFSLGVQPGQTFTERSEDMVYTLGPMCMGLCLPALFTLEVQY
jgi:hypothetical protein